MPNRFFAQFALPLIFTALLLSPPAQAKTATWYRVEMMVFSRPAGSEAEQWNPTPDLAYPDESRMLTRVAATSESKKGALNGVRQATPLTILPKSQQEFSGRAAAMRRSGAYRVLFHEAWTQQMASQADTLPIVLDKSGDEGVWPDLQGSIKLYVARYLYLETNLWLNTRGEYLQGSWRMPAPPLGPSSSIVLVEEQKSPREAPGAYQPTAAVPQPTSLAIQTSGKITEQLEPIYPFRHAVRLTQTRRMRSGEVHYIDHPMLGIIVKITPLIDKKLETKVEAESP